MLSASSCQLTKAYYKMRTTTIQNPELCRITVSVIFAIVITIFSNCSAQTSSGKEMGEGYDSLLAKRLGADEYGMKRYVIAFLKTGPVKMTDSTERKRLQSGHLLNIQRLAKEGKLIIAGPFLDGQNLRGIFVFNVETVEEAKQLAASDPAVKAGIFELEFHPWYGSAALMETTRLHHRLERTNIFK